MNTAVSPPPPHTHLLGSTVAILCTSTMSANLCEHSVECTSTITWCVTPTSTDAKSLNTTAKHMVNKARLFLGVMRAVQKKKTLAWQILAIPINKLLPIDFEVTPSEIFCSKIQLMVDVFFSSFFFFFLIFFTMDVLSGMYPYSRWIDKPDVHWIYLHLSSWKVTGRLGGLHIAWFCRYKISILLFSFYPSMWLL